MATQFDADTAVHRLDTGAHQAASSAKEPATRPLHTSTRFGADVKPDWATRGGPHGGYLAAIIMRALTETVADPARGARSLTVHFARPPAPGAVQIEVTVERQGRSLSTLSARMLQAGKLIALALSAFSAPWDWPDHSELPPPQVSEPDPNRQAPEQLAQSGPYFMKYLTVQPRIGGLPFSSPGQPMETGGWLGFLDPRPLDPIALAFLADAWFPAVFVSMQGFARVPTIDLTVHFRAPLRPSSSDELALVRFHTTVIKDGFFEEDGLIWAPDGTVLAHSRQLGIMVS